MRDLLYFAAGMAAFGIAVFCFTGWFVMIGYAAVMWLIKEYDELYYVLLRNDM